MPEAERTEVPANEGYRILRFWNNEILRNLNGVHQAIADALAAAPPPNLPHRRGELYDASEYPEMKYSDWQQVRLGDIVSLGNDRGVVVCSIDTEEYADAYPRSRVAVPCMWLHFWNRLGLGEILRDITR